MPSQIKLRLSRCLPPIPWRVRSLARLEPLPLAPLLAAVALSAFLAACGAPGSVPTEPAIVTVTPTSAQPFPGTGVQFHAAVQNASSSALTWEVNQIPGGNATVGTISASGYYTAPAAVPTPAIVTVTAVLQSASASGSAQVTIQSLSAIQGPLTLSPLLSSVTTSQPLQLQVLTPGVSASDVHWAVDGFTGGNASVGAISAAGLYSPPPAAGSHTVTAVLIANPSAIGSAAVEVTDFAGNLTWRNDNARSGINNRELALAPAKISPTTFGKLFSCPIDGYAYAQPLYVPNLPIAGGIHNVVFVATEKDSVFAFDADSSPCVQLWQQSLIPAGLQVVSNAEMDVVPFVGITGTPAIDANTSTLYAVSESQNIALNPTYTHSLYALDLATGQFKIRTTGLGLTSPDLRFDSSVEGQRSALLLDNGSLYIGFGSNGLPGDYHGWLFQHDIASLLQTGAFNVTEPPSIQGGIWQSGGGPSADVSHQVFVVTGDGPFNAIRTLQSFSYGDSFLRFGTAGGLSVSDYFTPCDQSTFQAAGNDLGASAPVLLPDSPGEPHLLIGASKAGVLYVVDRDAMGKFACPNLTSQTIPVGGTILSTPLFWNDVLYVAPGNANLQSFLMTGGVLASSPSPSQSPQTLGPQGATPVISANGTNNAILWLIDSSGASSTPPGPAILRAYDPRDLSKELYDSNVNASRDKAGPAVKFTVPTVANGKVYVGTQMELDVYGLLP